MYALVYTQCKPRRTESKQGEERLPVAVLESSLSHCLSWDLGPRYFPHEIRKRDLFPSSCALGGRPRRGSGHAVFAQLQFCSVSEGRAPVRGLVLGLTSCGVETWASSPCAILLCSSLTAPCAPTHRALCWKPSTFGKSLPPCLQGQPTPAHALQSGSDTLKEMRRDIR